MNAGHFNNSHESSGDLNRGRRTESRVLFGYFLHDAKSDNPFPFREARGSANLESAYPNNSFPLTKLNPFPKGDSRFCKPRISAQNQNFARTKLNPLPLCLLESWSPCSRPFAILPVSAVSDAQKLATGNFLHVRAASFGGKAAKSRAPNGARLFIPPGYSRLSAELRRIFRVLVLSNSR